LGDKIKKNEMGRACSMYMRERRRVYRILVGNLRERDHLGDPGVDGWIIIRWIFGKLDVVVWTASSWLRTGTKAGTYECNNEPSNSIKHVEFLD
jgi:hypothetical protein